MDALCSKIRYSVRPSSLEPVFGSILSRSSIPRLCNEPLPENSNWRAVADRVHATLPLNLLQRLTAQEILDHVIQSQGTPRCPDNNLLERRQEVMIAAATGRRC